MRSVDLLMIQKKIHRGIFAVRSLKTWLAPWAYVASVTYHDMFWYPLKGKRHIQTALESDWGALFQNWGRVPRTSSGFPDVGQSHPELVRMGLKHFLEGSRLMGMAVMESPEVKGTAARQKAAAHLHY
jgi:hypothetical protein